MSNNLFKITTSILITLISGCTDYFENDMTKLAKCKLAGQEIGDGMLEEAAFRKFDYLTSQIQNAKNEARETINKVKLELYPTGEPKTPQKIEYAEKIALKWASSDLCKKEREEFKISLIEESKKYKISLSKNAPANCQDYEYQHKFAFRIPELGTNSEEVRAALFLTIEDTLNSQPTIQQYKRDAIYEFLKRDNGPKEFSHQIVSSCVEAKSDIKSAILNIKSIKELKSERTIEIEKLIKNQTKETHCGANPDLYCHSDLAFYARKNAEVRSRQCDSMDTDTIECNISHMELLDSEFCMLKVEALEKSKVKLQRQIDDPKKYFGNYEGYLTHFMETCKRDAIKRKILGAQFYEYVKSTCEPLAINQMLKAPKERIGFIDQEIAACSSNDIEVVENAN